MADFWKDRQVCVTGAGFLGCHLVACLRERGARVRVFTLPNRPGHPLESLANVETVFGDILDANAVRRAVAGCEFVFHTAGLVSVWGASLPKMHAVHVDGTKRVLEAADSSARVVHTSSVVAVGASLRAEVLNEDSPFGLGSIRIDYVHAKRNAELEALAAAQSGQNVVIVNPAYLVGPDDHEPSVMGKFCQRFWRGQLLAAPPGGLNFVDVRDVALGHLLAAEKGQAGRRYILGNENLSLRTFMARLAETACFRPRAIPTVPGLCLTSFAELAEWRARWTGREPYPGRQHALLNRYFWYYHSERAGQELAYHPRPLSETLRDTFEWFQQKKPFTWKGLNRWWLRPAA